MARIIVIEDEGILCKVLVEILLRRGHEADSAQSGEKGMEMLRQEPFDVALVDIRLPDIDGLDLAREIHLEFPNTRIILMSGGSESQDEEYREMAMSYGVSEVIHKPFLVEKLLETIAYVMRGQLAVPRRQQAN